MDPYFRSPLRRGAVAATLVLLALLSITAIGCGSSGLAGPAHPDDEESTGISSSVQATSDEAMEGAVVVDAKEFEFAPSTIRVPAGKPVKIVLNNDGRIEHEILIRELSVKIVATQPPHDMHSSGEAGQAMSEHVKAGRFHVHAGPGAEASEVLQADAPGTYEFACEIPGHKEAGMIGRIEVRS